MQKKIGFLGGGNMAQALISGLLGSGVPAGNIMVSDPNDNIRAMLMEKGVQTTTDAEILIDFADAMVLAIKPQLFSTVLPPLKGQFDNTLVISVAAGITLKNIENLIGSNNIVRAMPNTPALIQAGATGLYANDNISEDNKQTAEAILATAGLVVWVENEALIHAVTAVSGSAPAYFFYMMESMIVAGKAMGLSQSQAEQLTLQTAFGAAKMALNSEDKPITLREKVTSPNGTTHAAIENMKANQFADIITKAMEACVARSEEMAKNN